MKHKLKSLKVTSNCELRFSNPCSRSFDHYVEMELENEEGKEFTREGNAHLNITSYPVVFSTYPPKEGHVLENITILFSSREKDSKSEYFNLDISNSDALSVMEAFGELNNFNIGKFDKKVAMGALV